MESGSGFFIVIGIFFLGWLMWSSKTAKETFLFYSWTAMLGMTALDVIYHVIFK